MPASETPEGRRGGRLLTVVFWIGVGLAPLAALLVLVSTGDQALRVAAVLAILAVVLIGLSIMLRPDAGSVRIELEETLLDEIDMLRDDVRADITTAARATHKAFSEKLQTLHEDVESLRGQVESVRSGDRRTDAKPVDGVHGAAVSAPSMVSGSALVGGGVVRHTETVRETTRQTIVDPGGDGGRSGTVYGTGTVYGGRSGEPPATPVASGRHGGEHTDPGRGRSDRRGGWDSGRSRAEPERDRESRGDWTSPSGESWTDQRQRERPGESRGTDSRSAASRGSARVEPRGFDDRDDGYRSGETPRPRSYGRDDDPADGGRWSGVRAGDRWAAVRSDERGRELRVGERHASVHSDGSGTEVRIEDRWAAVRREEAGTGESRRSRREREERWAAESTGGGRRRRDDDAPWSMPGWERTGSGDLPPAEPSWSAERASQRRGSTPALPAAGEEPASAWTSSWRHDRDDRDREPRRRRDEERDDRWEREDTGARTSRPRRLAFELSDDRWR